MPYAATERPGINLKLKKEAKKINTEPAPLNIGAGAPT